MLNVEDVTHRYGKVTALQGLTMAVLPGEVVGIVGPNGSGKSTVVGLVCGSLSPTAGRVLLGDARPGSPKAVRRIGFVPPVASGLDRLSVEEFLDLYRVCARVAATDYWSVAEQLLEAFDIAPKRNTEIGSLSTGQRRIVQHVAVAARAPDLIVIDEAGAALDPEAKIRSRAMLRSSSRHGTAVLIATQDLDYAERLCDRIIVLSNGRCVVSGTPFQLRKDYGAADLEDVFLAATVKAPDKESVDATGT